MPIYRLADFPNYVLFVPNALLWHYAFKGRYTKEQVFDFYSNILKIYEKHYPSHKVVMLPQTFYQGPEADDYNFFVEIRKREKDNRIVVIPDTYSSDIQQAVIKKAACMVGARYHSVVFAVNQGIPFVALSYEHKIKGLLEHLGKLDSMIDITKSMETEDTLKESYRQFEQCLAIAKPDENARMLAKKSAQNCMKKFLELFVR